MGDAERPSANAERPSADAERQELTQRVWELRRGQQA